MKKVVMPTLVLLTGTVLGLVASGAFPRGRAEPGAPPRAPASYRDVVRKVLPAVASIETRVKGRGARPLVDEPEDRPNEAPQGFGSGFVVDPKGYVLTNYHVVEGADQVEVTLTDGRKFTSRDVKSDPKTDLALVKLDPKGEALPFLELGDSDQMEIGDPVLALGAPFGLSGSVTHGIISAKGRSLRMNLYEDYLQTDAAINPGNSGGPLVNLEGKVIAINSAIKSRSGGWQGVGLAIASNLARDVMLQLQRDGVVRRGYLGLQMKDVDTPELAEKLGLKAAQGAVVTLVFDNAPAGKAGLKSGDVIVDVAGKPIKDSRELQGMVARLPIGKPTELTVVRDGEAKTLTVTIEEQPQSYGTPRVPAPPAPGNGRGGLGVGRLGVEVAELTPEVAERLGYREGVRGVVITEVERDGPAAAAGLRAGLVIRQVDRKPVETPKAFRELVEAAAGEKGFLLQVVSPLGGTNYVVVRPAER